MNLSLVSISDFSESSIEIEIVRVSTVSSSESCLIMNDNNSFRPRIELGQHVHFKFHLARLSFP